MKSRIPVYLTAAASMVITLLAFALSFVALSDLAARFGVPSELAWAVPLVVDGLAIVATVAVSVLDSGRAYPWSVLIVSTALSVVGNSVHAAHITGGSIIAVCIAAIPPLAVLGSIHLTVVIARQGAAPAEPDEDAAPDAAPDTAVLPQDEPAGSAAPEESAAPPSVPHLFAAPAAVRSPQVRAVAAVVDEAPADEPAAPPKAAAKPRRSSKRIADDPEVVSRAARLCAAGESLRGIGRELGVDDRTVRRWRDEGLLQAS